MTQEMRRLLVLAAVLAFTAVGPRLPLDEFAIGREAFEKRPKADAGLGPLFNAESCRTCHKSPTAGGSSGITVMKVALARSTGEGTVSDSGLALAMHATDPRCHPSTPPGTLLVAHRVTTPLFGAGLVDAIPDNTLRALADPDDRDGDGIRGRAARVIDVVSGKERVGRFGWKAQHASLLGFVADAYAHEMGVTNRLFPREPRLGADPAAFADCDRTADPEDRPGPDGKPAIDEFTAFLALLQPIARAPQTDATRAGEQLFEHIGCARCHTPRLMTGAHMRPSLSHQPVNAYSDFLLHDIGFSDGIRQADAGPREMRTAPLWGLRLREFLLHDGGYPTPEDAIEQHAGEATAVRNAFRALSPRQRASLLAFLGSL